MTSRETPRFVIDHMLIKLGKYLRILGCDAVWSATLRTHELIVRANRDGRVFLTRNRHLPYAYPEARQVYTVTATEPAAQLHEVVEAFGLDPQARLFSACIRCNVSLENIEDKGTLAGVVIPEVLARYDCFYRCPSCGTVFWKGSHVRNTCRKLGLAAPAEGQARPWPDAAE